MFILDTDALSQTSPFSSPNFDARSWIERHRDESFLSAVTLAELHFGLERLRAKGAVRKAAGLEHWVAEVTRIFSARTLPVDAETARRAGELLAGAVARGQDPGLADACIAATAERAGFEVVSFNLRHFALLGAACRPPADSHDGAP